ncbi:lysis protein [Escherichia phage MS2]|uniref:Lysis protein n=1 Tax=Escherichia phage MS2 TaxID=12022 RepID=C8XPG5_BPMS2|nr:lysis protein [Escherichia phage MS2]
METQSPQQSQPTPESINRFRPFQHEDYPCRRQQRSSTLYVLIFLAIFLSKFTNQLLLSLLEAVIRTVETLRQLLT